MRLATDGTKQNAPLFYLALSLFIFLIFAALTASNAFASSKAPLNDSLKGLKQEQQDQYVVLISLDGFRHDYIELHNAQHLGAIAKKG